MKRVSVRALATEAGIDVDEALIELWDAGFDGINGPQDLLVRGEANRARRALGLPTRRALASPEYWCGLFACDDHELDALLEELGVTKPFSGRHLTKKAQHRLSAAAIERGRPTIAGQGAAVPAATSPAEPLVWELVGHERECHILTTEQVLLIHHELVADFALSRDPISPSGVKSMAMLDSAVHRPETSSGDVLKYPTVEMGAAALLHALVHNHPFHNGNKRTALVSMIVFIDQNGFVLTAEEDEVFKLVLQLAQHALAIGDRSEMPDREVLHVAKWLKQRIRRKEKGDRAIPWRELRPILIGFGCECERAARGQRLKVTREVQRGSTWLLRLKRRATLSSVISNVWDGRDVDRHTLSRLREDLELDDAHGVDSAAFYADATLSTSDFIRTYQGILRRLANV